MTSAAILSDWQSDYASRLLNPLTNRTYRSDDEALQEMFKVLTTGLQFTLVSRLGCPLGTYDRPHPKRAEKLAIKPLCLQRRLELAVPSTAVVTFVGD